MKALLALGALLGFPSSQPGKGSYGRAKEKRYARNRRRNRFAKKSRARNRRGL